MIAVLIPTLGRAHNIKRVIDDLEPTAPRNLIDPIFIVEEHDTPTREAIEAIQRTYIINKRSPSYSGAINTAVDETTPEAVATAKFRGQFRACLDSKVEHLHWVWGLANLDDTYNKGSLYMQQDQSLFTNRSHLWT
jgi:glycosyltransferase involved in cell wall biosynthesis